MMKQQHYNNAACTKTNHASGSADAANTSHCTNNDCYHHHNNLMQPTNHDHNLMFPYQQQPQRTLTAYSLFFQVERKRIIYDESDRSYTHAEIIRTLEERRRPKPRRKHRKSHGKVGFTELVKIISSKWRSLDKETKKFFECYAREESETCEKQQINASKGKMNCATTAPPQTLLTNTSNDNILIEYTAPPPPQTLLPTVSTDEIAVPERIISPELIFRNMNNDQSMNDSHDDTQSYSTAGTGRVSYNGQNKYVMHRHGMLSNCGSYEHKYNLTKNELKNVSCARNEDAYQNAVVDKWFTLQIQMIRQRMQCRERIFQQMKQQMKYYLFTESLLDNDNTSSSLVNEKTELHTENTMSVCHHDTDCNVDEDINDELHPLSCDYSSISYHQKPATHKSMQNEIQCMTKNDDHDSVGECSQMKLDHHDFQSFISIDEHELFEPEILY
jgi:HMG-box domain